MRSDGKEECEGSLSGDKSVHGESDQFNLEMYAIDICTYVIVMSIRSLPCNATM